ncbi:type II secretion system GspH family protein [Burkholderiaceae bacterium DAT-1]|nr:type II secretion system GspH family protein [Burkholderiaceae bacterium DAT-1]
MSQSWSDFSQRGMTLLEVLVAMLLISLLGGALLEWSSNSLSIVSRVSKALDRQILQENGLQFAKGINPAEQPSGRDVVGNVEFTWESQAITPLVQQSRHIDKKVVYLVALYKLNVTVHDRNNGLQEQIDIKQFGFKKFREVNIL